MLEEINSTYRKTQDAKSPLAEDPEQDMLLMEEQVREIKRLRAHIGNMQVQIADYQQIVKELSDKIVSLKKNI